MEGGIDSQSFYPCIYVCLGRSIKQQSIFLREYSNYFDTIATKFIKQSEREGAGAGYIERMIAPLARSRARSTSRCQYYVYRVYLNRIFPEIVWLQNKKHTETSRKSSYSNNLPAITKLGKFEKYSFSCLCE